MTRSPSARRGLALLGLAATAAVVATGLAAPPAQAASENVVISELYGGGGNSGAPFTHDFVELYNTSANPVNLNGWVIEQRSSAGNLGNSCTISGTIPGHSYFLVQGAAGTGGAAALPTADFSACNFNFSATNAVARLKNDTGQYVDILGTGTASGTASDGVANAEGTAAPAMTNTTSAARKTPIVDTDNNSVDFAVGAPTPQASGSPGEPTPTPTVTPTTTPTATPTTTPPPGTVTPIAEIQGTGDTTPMNGRRVTTQGVVTAAYETGGFNGIYIQTPGTGGQPKSAGQASDGIFVYFASNLANLPQPGQCINVTGTAGEYNGLTQLAGPEVTPAAGCAQVVPTELATLPATDADKEPYEGMLVLPKGTYTITNNYALNQFGQLDLAFGDKPLYQATEKVAPGAAATAYEAENLKKLITLDDGSSWNFLTNNTAKNSPLPYLSAEEPMRTASQLTFNKPVILDYRFQWNFQPTGQIVGATDEQDPVVSENDRPATPKNVGGDVKLGVFNVLNYFDDLGKDEEGCRPYTDRNGTPVAANNCVVRGAYSQEAFADQEAKIVTAINTLGADVVGLQEIETSSQIPYRQGQNRDKALNTLVAALNADPNRPGTWAAVPTGAVVPQSEDVIRTAFIYNTEKIELEGASEILQVTEFSDARYPLAQKFRAKDTDTTFVAINNHFKSKGSGEDDGTGQGNANPSRERQATALVNWVGQRFADEAVFLLGDFNAYSKETPIQRIEAAGFTELVHAEDPDAATYQFSGRLGSLDHVFGNAKARELVTGATVYDINGDESIAFQYSRRNYNVTDFHANDQYASSDHDPTLVGLKTSGSSEPEPEEPQPNFPVKGAIGQKWTATGGLDGPLGQPLGNEIGGLKDGGWYQIFEGGVVTWAPGVPASITKNGIRDKWMSLSAENGRLGYPRTDEICGLKDGGCYQAFQGGFLVWSPATGTHVSWGGIREVWARNGAENGRLGYATTDEIALANGGFRQDYQGGSIYWSPATGGHTVWGGIGDYWKARGAETSAYGYPTTAEQCGQVNGIQQCVQYFQRGSISWNARVGIF